MRLRTPSSDNSRKLTRQRFRVICGRADNANRRSGTSARARDAPFALAPLEGGGVMAKKRRTSTAEPTLEEIWFVLTAAPLAEVRGDEPEVASVTHMSIST
jgi:hypothetical protein